VPGMPVRVMNYMLLNLCCQEFEKMVNNVGVECYT